MGLEGETCEVGDIHSIQGQVTIGPERVYFDDRSLISPFHILLSSISFPLLYETDSAWAGAIPAEVPQQQLQNAQGYPSPLRPRVCVLTYSLLP